MIPGHRGKLAVLLRRIAARTAHPKALAAEAGEGETWAANRVEEHHDLKW
jgi:hypothetical protein